MAAGAELARFLECGSSGDYQEQIRRLAGPNALMEVEGGFCPDPDFFLERVLNLKG